MTIALNLVTKVPPNLNTRQITAFNIAAFCQHTCTTSLERLAKISTSTCRTPDFKPSCSERFEIISALWTIIDALDTMRSAVETEKSYLKHFLDDDLLKRLRIARKMRNYKSHISENINNIANKGKYFPPLGIAKWFIVNQIGGEEKGKIYIVSADYRFTSNNDGKPLSMAIDMLDGADGEIGLKEPSFALQTDQNILNLTWTIKLAERYFIRVASDFEARLTSAALASSVELAPPLEGYSFEVTVKR